MFILEGKERICEQEKKKELGRQTQVIVMVCFFLKFLLIAILYQLFPEVLKNVYHKKCINLIFSLVFTNHLFGKQNEMKT